LNPNTQQRNEFFQKVCKLHDSRLASHSDSRIA
jgi:hypothetical protein